LTRERERGSETRSDTERTLCTRLPEEHSTKLSFFNLKKEKEKKNRVSQSDRERERERKKRLTVEKISSR
jgi:hypothetical protein